MPKHRIDSGPVFLTHDHQVATVVMETVQLVLSQLKTFNVVNIKLNKVYLCQK